MGAKELYPLIKETYQGIKNGDDLNLLKKNFREQFETIVRNKESEYYKTYYQNWFCNKSDQLITRKIGSTCDNIFQIFINQNG